MKYRVKSRRFWVQLVWRDRVRATDFEGGGGMGIEMAVTPFFRLLCRILGLGLRACDRGLGIRDRVWDELSSATYMAACFFFFFFFIFTFCLISIVIFISHECRLFHIHLHPPSLLWTS